MNTKPTAPLLVALAPLAAIAPQIIIGGLIGGAIYLVLDSLFPVKKKPPEAVPVEASTEARKPAETVVFRQIPAEIPVKPAAVPVASAPHVIVPPRAVPSVPKVSAPVSMPAAVAIPKIVTQALPSPTKKKFVTREDLAAVFQRGARALTRTAAVAALKKLGFGKTAAYAALTPNGRFSAWLQCAPDGIITWTE